MSLLQFQRVFELLITPRTCQLSKKKSTCAVRVYGAEFVRNTCIDSLLHVHMQLGLGFFTQLLINALTDDNFILYITG